MLKIIYIINKTVNKKGLPSSSMSKVGSSMMALFDCESESDTHNVKLA